MTQIRFSVQKPESRECVTHVVHAGYKNTV